MTSPKSEISTGTEVLSADLWREHFDRAPMGMMILAGDRTIVRANDAMTAATGLSPAILHGSPFRRFLSTDAPLDLEDRIFEDIERSGRWIGELDIRTSIGETSPMMVTITPVGHAAESAGAADPAGAGRGTAPSAGARAARYVATVFDLGHQRWIEAESSRRAAELAAFAALAVATGSSSDPQAMLSMAAREIVEELEIDACWIFRYEADRSALVLGAEASYLNPSLRLSSHMIPDAINPGVLHALQSGDLVTESELLDRSIATVVHVPLLARDEAAGVMSLLSVEGEKLSTRNSDLLRAVSYQLGTAIQNLSLLQSVREQQGELEKTNQRLEDLVVELREADRMKNEFLANTSHELRTPLNSIIGFLNLVIEGLVEDDAEQMELLTHASNSARSLLGLINDVLDVARIEAGRLQVECASVSLGPLLDEVARTMEVQAREKGLELTATAVPDGLLVIADETRLRQVLMNLLGNAIKFTPKGSVLVSVAASEGSPFVEVAVCDSGIGIGEEKMARLFRKFSQGDTSTTRKFGGTGLGLVIVKELVEMMGGTVLLESAGEGKGTIVTLSLARATSCGAAPATGAAPPTAG